MNKLMPTRVVSSNDRRLRIERRQFSYTLHIPERRSAGERRGRIAANHAINLITMDKPERVMAA
ncbi:MAG: hypothetical protein B6I22_07795 [Desulfobacteraceae bacterium 4572_123]|nr:MAG: hypothetical protein B6I22_07795 [Desulfobacteraceae bacterium 4572_123]